MMIVSAVATFAEPHGKIAAAEASLTQSTASYQQRQNLDKQDAVKHQGQIQEGKISVFELSVCVCEVMSF